MSCHIISYLILYRIVSCRIVLYLSYHNITTYIMLRYDIYIIFFFLCWRYNPLWVLAFSVIFFHSILSLLSFLHPLIPIVWISSSTSSIHLSIGLPLILLPIDFHSNIFLGIFPPSIRVTCPSQAIRLLLLSKSYYI